MEGREILSQQPLLPRVSKETIVEAMLKLNNYREIFANAMRMTSKAFGVSTSHENNLKIASRLLPLHNDLSDYARVYSLGEDIVLDIMRKEAGKKKFKLPAFF